MGKTWHARRFTQTSSLVIGPHSFVLLFIQAYMQCTWRKREVENCAIS